MKNEKLLEKLFEIKNALTEWERGEKILSLIDEAKKEIVEENAKKSGRGSLHKLADEILKLAKNNNAPPALKYELTDGSAFYVCDFYRIMRYEKPFGFPALPENVPSVAIDNTFKTQIQGERVPLELPTVSALDSWVKIKKAEKVKKPCYDFGFGNVTINAHYLLSALKNMDIVGAYGLKWGFLFEDRSGAQLVILGVRRPNGAEVKKTELP